MLSCDAFLTCLGCLRANRLLLTQFLIGGRPTVVSKVGDSREAAQKKSKKSRAKTSPVFSLDVFRTFFRQPRAKHIVLRPFWTIDKFHSKVRRALFISLAVNPENWLLGKVLENTFDIFDFDPMDPC